MGALALIMGSLGSAPIDRPIDMPTAKGIYLGSTMNKAKRKKRDKAKRARRASRLNRK